MATVEFPRGAFRRTDEEDDALFYAIPRKGVHLDDGALATLTQLYAELLPADGVLLDLMASWRSHLPVEFRGTVIGLGLNREEMADNPRLARAVIHDLNKDPHLLFADQAFDGAMCAVSIQYLTAPVKVFSEVHRVLKPGAPFLVSFSNRCFPEKAVTLWLAGTDEDHARVVALYFRASDGWGDLAGRAYTPPGADPLYAVWARRA